MIVAMLLDLFVEFSLSDYALSYLNLHNNRSFWWCILNQLDTIFMSDMYERRSWHLSDYWICCSILCMYIWLTWSNKYHHCSVPFIVIYVPVKSNASQQSIRKQVTYARTGQFITNFQIRRYGLDEAVWGSNYPKVLQVLLLNNKGNASIYYSSYSIHHQTTSKKG